VSTPHLLSSDSSRVLNEELTRRFSRWLVGLNYSKCVLDKYPRTVRQFSTFLHARKFLKVTHFDIQEFLANSAAKGQTPKLVREQLYALRVFFDFLNLGGLVKWVPPRMVKMRPMQRHVPKILTQEQLRQVLGAACSRHEIALLELLYGTGCRTGELRTMRIENIDFEHRRIRVTGKTGTRILMFTRTAGRALRTYIGRRESGFVFIEQKPLQKIRPVRCPRGGWYCRWKVYDEVGNYLLTKAAYISPRKRVKYREAITQFSNLAKDDKLLRPLGVRPLSQSVIQKAVHKIGLRVGVRITPYSFRHTFATHLLDNGADLRVIQELLGHRSIRSTEVYTHVSKKQLQRTFDECHPRK
jgi:site-specific recombinase XerD